MKNYFNIKDSLFDITEKYPETLDLFISNGFEQMKDESKRKGIGKTISLEIALSMKNLNGDSFVKKLEELIEQNSSATDTTLIQKEQCTVPDVIIRGVLPCPVKEPLMIAFDKFMNEKVSQSGIKVDYELKAASNGVTWIKDSIEKADNEEELPDIFISAGFDLFFDKNLIGKFKNSDIFEDLTGFQKLNEDLDNDNICLKDPNSQYSLLAVVPAIFLINTKELNGREVPKSWSDILKPEFEHSVSLPVGDFDLFNSIVLNIYKQYGEEGVTNLSRSLLKNMHPSQMVKSHMKAGEKPIVTVMPYFFTWMVKEGSPMKAVWPEDGAIISPIFMLTKKSKKNKVMPFVDFLGSKEVGEILSHNGKFPSINPQVDNMIPKENKFMWLGWDFIRNNDIEATLKYCISMFNNAI